MTNVVFMPYYWQTYNICSRKALRNVRSSKANKRRRLTTEQLIPHWTTINYRHIISPPHRYKGTFFGFMGNSCRFVLLRGLKDNDITHVIHPATHTQLSSPCEHDSVASILHVYYVWLYVSSWGQPHQTQKPKWLSSTEHQSYLTMSAHIHPNTHIFAI